jgi:hypothetical protein
VAELQVKLAQHEAAAAALQDAQKQLQAKTDVLASTQQQLREEQRGRAAAEAAAQKAERALERAKTALQDKLDSKEENLLVYDKSVQEVGVSADRHTCRHKCRATTEAMLQLCASRHANCSMACLALEQAAMSRPIAHHASLCLMRLTCRSVCECHAIQSI